MEKSLQREESGVYEIPFLEELCFHPCPSAAQESLASVWCQQDRQELNFHHIPEPGGVQKDPSTPTVASGGDGAVYPLEALETDQSGRNAGTRP